MEQAESIDHWLLGPIVLGFFIFAISIQVFEKTTIPNFQFDHLFFFCFRSFEFFVDVLDSQITVKVTALCPLKDWQVVLLVVLHCSAQWAFRVLHLQLRAG